MSPLKIALSFAAVFSAVFLAYVLFSLKYDVLTLENKRKALLSQIRTNQEAIHTLQAEWTYLNDPGRLKNLISTYTDLRPVSGKQVKTLDLFYATSASEEED